MGIEFRITVIKDLHSRDHAKLIAVASSSNTSPDAPVINNRSALPISEPYVANEGSSADHSSSSSCCRRRWQAIKTTEQDINTTAHDHRSGDVGCHLGMAANGRDNPSVLGKRVQPRTIVLAATSSCPPIATGVGTLKSSAANGPKLPESLSRARVPAAQRLLIVTNHLTHAAKLTGQQGSVGGGAPGVFQITSPVAGSSATTDASGVPGATIKRPSARRGEPQIPQVRALVGPKSVFRFLLHKTMPFRR